jgi:hypothetical protein
VDNHHDAPAARGTNLALRARDHTERAQAHDRRRPLHRPVLRNGRWRGLRLTIRAPTSTPLAQPRYALTIREAAAQPARQAPLNPSLSRWLPLIPHRTRHRFATTNASRETNALRTTNAPRPLRSGAITMQQSRQPPLNPAGWHACCNHWNAPCHSAPDKGKVS